MLFNSLEFAYFLPLVFVGYWFLFHQKLKLQNGFLLFSSYFFYGWWDYRFLGLIAFSTVLDYIVSQKIYSETNLQNKKHLLWLSLLVNLGFLGVFKYYDFFIESFVSSFGYFGITIEANTLGIILPVGISFYTFQTLSYTIDVYKGKLKPTESFIDFAAFVSFFPQLVAGPIERATNLLPQISKKREFDLSLASDGMRQMLWGFFKKIVIADNCAFYVNEIFANYQSYDIFSLIVGVFLFSLQIYGDFSGYSDIAIGLSKLFGIKLMQNFAFPYFSRDIAEFWRRWHISLSTWFRDYLYIPLGGSRGSNYMRFRNTLIIFLVSGFWHGANWTFIVWGGLHALFFVPLLLFQKNRVNTGPLWQDRLLPSFKDLLGILITYILTCFAWVFFRAESLDHAFNYIYYLGVRLGHSFRTQDGDFGPLLRLNINPILYALIFFMFFMEYTNRNSLHGLSMEKPSTRVARWILYFVIVIAILTFRGTSQDFIYFQF